MIPFERKVWILNEHYMNMKRTLYKAHYISHVTDSNFKLKFFILNVDVKQQRRKRLERSRQYKIFLNCSTIIFDVNDNDKYEP